MIKNFIETKKINTKSDLRLLLTSHNVGFTVQGHESEETSLDISLELNGNIPDDLTLKDILKVEYKEKKNELIVEYKEPDHIHTQNARIEILVPHKTMVASNLSNGGVRLDDLTGNHNLESHNGSIKVTDNKGNASCKTRNGSLKLEDCEGDIEAKTRNGSIAIRSCYGSMNIGGENGSCKISKCKGTLTLNLENGPIRIIEGAFDQAELKNNNGSIYYEFLPVDKGDFSFKNKNGKILLIIPEEIEFSLKAENHLGNIIIGLDGEYDRKKDDESQSIEMVKGAGKVKIIVKNQLGSIQLMKDPIQKDTHIDFSSFGDYISDIFDNIPFEEGEAFHKREGEKESMSESRMKILDMLKKGTITPDEAERLLKALGEDDE